MTDKPEYAAFQSMLGTMTELTRSLVAMRDILDDRTKEVIKLSGEIALLMGPPPAPVETAETPAPGGAEAATPAEGGGQGPEGLRPVRTSDLPVGIRFRRGKYVAEIQRCGAKFSLGHYRLLEDAVAARKAGEERLIQGLAPEPPPQRAFPQARRRVKPVEAIITPIETVEATYEDERQVEKLKQIREIGQDPVMPVVLGSGNEGLVVFRKTEAQLDQIGKLPAGKMLTATRQGETGTVATKTGAVEVDGRLVPVLNHLADGGMYPLKDLLSRAGLGPEIFQLHVGPLKSKLESLSLKLDDSTKHFLKLEALG